MVFVLSFINKKNNNLHKFWSYCFLLILNLKIVKTLSYILNFDISWINNCEFSSEISVFCVIALNLLSFLLLAAAVPYIPADISSVIAETLTQSLKLFQSFIKGVAYLRISNL